MTTLWTIGHSTRTGQEFTDALQSFGVKTLVDIRRFPTSKRNKQYEADDLRRLLHAAGIKYVWMGDTLGGMRDRRPASRHVGLHDSAFQAYADWMETGTFRRGVDRLLAVAADAPTAVMCAERIFKSCHRKLLSDHLALLRGVDVVHIGEASRSQPHPTTPGVRVEQDGLLYLSAASAAPIESFDSGDRSSQR